MTRGLHALDYVIVLAYLAGVLWIGIRFSKDQREGDDYFVAGRRLPWLAVGLSIVATLLSTVSYLATPGELIQHGVAMSLGWLALPVAFVVVNFLWIPFLMRLGVTSIYEYLEQRFGLAARWLGAALFVFVLRLIWMSIIVLTASRAVAQITYPSVSELLPIAFSEFAWTQVVLLAVGLLATFYTMLGGMKAVVWTDVAQFVVLFLGAVLTIVFISWDTGTGFADWWQNATAGPQKFPKWFSLNIYDRNVVAFTCLHSITWYCCTFLADQVAVQRYFSTPSVGAAVRGNLVNFLADFAIMLLLAVCGMALLTYYTDPQYQTEIVRNVTDPRDPAAADHVFPHYIAHGLPTGISGLVVAALFAVAMSSLDSGVNSVAAVLTLDFYRVWRPQISERDELRAARLLTLVVGLLCTLLAWGALYLPERHNIIGISARTFNCALAPLAGMFLAGMFLRRVGQTAVIFGTLVGFAVALAVSWWSELCGVFGWQTASPGVFLINPLALLASLTTSVALSWVFPSDAQRAAPLMWTAVLRRRPDDYQKQSKETQSEKED